MRKRLLSTLLAVCLMLTLLPGTVWAADIIASGECGENLTWELDSDGTLTIRGTGAMTNYRGASARPPWYENRANIRTIAFPDEITAIGDYTFSSCSNLLNVTIPNNVTYIGKSAFYESNIASITLSNNISTIGEWAFGHCRNLASISVPASVMEIGKKAFLGCNSLTAINVSPDNRKYRSIDGVLYSADDSTLIVYPAGKIDKQYSILDGTLTITESGFYGCSNLVVVNIPSSVSFIEEDAFMNSDHLSNIVVDSNNTRYCSIDGILFSADCKKLVVYPGGKPEKSYSILDSVTELGYYAFWGCKNLTSIEIPSNVRVIGGAAFGYCENLLNITIPNSISQLGSFAFYGCKKLKDVYFQGSEEQWKQIYKITASSGTDYLKSATIHYLDLPINPDPGPNPPVSGDSGIIALFPANGSKGVGYDASNPPEFRITFDQEINTPDGDGRADVNLTSAEPFSIYRKSDGELVWKPTEFSGSNFTVVYGDKNTLVIKPTNRHALLDPLTEYYIVMGEGFVHFADGTGSPEIKKGEWEFKTSPFEKDGTFTFPGSNGKNIEYSYSYSDNFFFKAGNIYNHNLANMSLNLAMSAFNSLEAPASNYDELVAAKNVRKLLSDLRFKDIETNIAPGNNSYSGMPYTNSIAAAYGKKNITTDDGDFTLIAVAIRGGGYEAEWGGNLTVGQTGNHRGFQLASDKVLEGLKEYINSQNISGDIKVWITGYSRAAATANLTAAAIDDGNLFTGINAVNNLAVHLSTNNVYAYTFETPMGTTNNTSSSLYNNIFNIVNPIDLVPKVAPDMWGFGRYGITYYMPSGNTNTVGYSDVIMQVTKEYSKIINGADSGTLSAIRQLTNQSAILDVFVDILSTQMPRTAYSPKYEHLLVPIVSEVMGADGSQYGENIFWAIEEFCLRYPDDAVDLVNALKEAAGNKIVWYIVAEQGFEQLYKALDWNGSTAVDTISMIGETIFQSHYPEVTMAWMRTINGADGYGSGKYRKLYVNCPVDISVYDSNNQLVAEIVDDNPQLIENSLISSYIDGNGQKIVILPTDMEYHVVINATDNGTMTYAVDEYNIDKATTDRIVGYSEIGITKDEVLTGLLENLDDVQKANYPLYRENETTPLKPDINNGGNDSSQPEKPSTSSGGSGHYISYPLHGEHGDWWANKRYAAGGESVQITVAPDDGYELEELTVTDIRGRAVRLKEQDNGKYSFIMPSSSVEIEASFAPIPDNSKVIGQISGGGQVSVPSSGYMPYIDVPFSAWYYNAVKFVHTRRLMERTETYRFSPGRAADRTALWLALGRLSGADLTGETARAWAMENGISDGTGAAEGITREQMATMFWRYAGCPSSSGSLSQFSDAGQVSDWAMDAVRWAVSKDILRGMGDGTLAPQGGATRAEAASLLQRLCEKIGQ